MDEMRMVKDVYGQPTPPTMRETEQARAQMFQDESGARRTRGFRIGFGWRAKIGLSVAAVGAAAAVGIAAVGTGAPAAGGGVAGGGGSQLPVDLGERAVLAAAENASKQKIGKYWFVNSVSGQSYVVPAETGPYAIVAANSESFYWTGVEAGMGSRHYDRDIPARPQTPADMKGWKEAGSPEKIKVWSSDKWLTWDMVKPNVKWTSGGTSEEGPRWPGNLTLEELQNMPTDPEKLAERFLSLKAIKGRMLGGNGAKGLPNGVRLSQLQVSTVGMGLARTPFPPEVRAGLMRALTAQPGITAIGETTDSLGRKGVGLAAEPRTVEITGEFGTPPEMQGTYEYRQEVVFDKETGEVLARQDVLTKPGGTYKNREPGFVIYYYGTRDMGWTDTKPTPPKELPF